MSRIEVLHKRYARALIDCAGENDSLDKVKADFAALNEIIINNPSLFKTLTHPELGLNEKQDLVDEIAKEQRFDRLFRDFIYLLIKENRFKLLHGIFLKYCAFYDLLKKRIKICVQTPFALSGLQKKKMIRALEERWRSEVVLEEKLNSDLIAGLSIRAEDNIFDNSLLKNLKFIEEAITQ